ncbi:MAG: YihY/virulence factor BrkB family protein [Oscillospiraceae bacterium]|nr:YihY/virulence factor BrkB family protein [Oscillospiraceae bacterium]
MRKKWMLRLENLFFTLNDLQIPVYAANACYFLAIAIFPGLLLVLASLRFTPLSATDLIRALEGILPSALLGAAESLIVSTYYNSSGAVVGISAVAALWSASRGVHGLLAGLNKVYGVLEDRSWFTTRLLSVVYTFVFLLLIIVTLVFQVFGESFADRFWLVPNPAVQFLVGLIDWRSVWLLTAQILLFALVYMVLPNRRNPFLLSLPGAALAALGWQGFSNIFSIYVDKMMTSYTNIYGSVYTVALGLLWMYCCMCIFLFGGLLNRLLMPRNLG